MNLIDQNLREFASTNNQEQPSLIRPLLRSLFLPGSIGNIIDEIIKKGSQSFRSDSFNFENLGPILKNRINLEQQHFNTWESDQKYFDNLQPRPSQNYLSIEDKSLRKDTIQKEISQKMVGYFLC